MLLESFELPVLSATDLIEWYNYDTYSRNVQQISYGGYALLITTIH